MSLNYYTGSLTPTSSGGGSEITVDSVLSTTSTNPVQNAVITNTINGYHGNEIPAGTIIEGKFSDLPTFFAGLEGKYCNGTVTYKITEDETLSTTTTTIDTRNYLVAIFMPHFMGKIVVDGNEKTITSSTASSIILGILPFSNDSGTTFDVNGNFNQTLAIENINFTNNGTSSNCIRNQADINLVLESITTSSQSHSIISVRGNTKIKSCQMSASGGWGLGIMNTCNGKSELNIYSNCGYAGLTAGLGGFVQSVNDTFTSCDKNTNVTLGGLIILNASSINTNSGNTNMQNYTIYNT